MRILLIENDIRFGAVISVQLKAEAVRVDIAECGEDALYLMRNYEFILVLLNMLLPDMNGTSLISRIRLAKHQTPIIAISAVSHTRLKALGVGANDVIERDIDQTELAALIRVIVRRSSGFSQSRLQVGGVTLHVDCQDVVANGVRVHFTNKEFAVLQLLVLRRNMVLTKKPIFSQLYGGIDEPEVKIVDVFVCKIRSKLIKAGLPTLSAPSGGKAIASATSEMRALWSPPCVRSQHRLNGSLLNRRLDRDQRASAASYLTTLANDYRELKLKMVEFV